MKQIIVFSFLFLTIFAKAEEGMLIPSLLSAFESDMKAKGMKISAADIYNVNNSSLKDAIMHFGGGCTAELVSNKGLLLTNHHCGLSQVQYHSTLEKDYLKNGFWAKNFNDELRNSDLTATRIVRIEDVTAQVLDGTIGIEDGQKFAAIIKKNMQVLTEDAIRGTHYKADIQAFDYGNSYYMMVKEVFLDVRLVGAPPSSIGKFGGDTDNWVWPRHTGDFSVFRIYADKNNMPASYSKDNVPYTPKQSLSISLKGIKPNDYTMIIGFPGRTTRFMTSFEARETQDIKQPSVFSTNRTNYKPK